MLLLRCVSMAALLDRLDRYVYGQRTQLGSQLSLIHLQNGWVICYEQLLRYGYAFV
jgi:hypothetical protein